MSPVPVMINTPLVRFHVRLSPHVPLWAKRELTLAIIASKNVKSLCFIIVFIDFNIVRARIYTTKSVKSVCSSRSMRASQSL